jgi:hypothetical protein
MPRLSSLFFRIVGAALGIVVSIAPAYASPAFSGTVYSFVPIGPFSTATQLQAEFATGTVACSISTDTINYTGSPLDFGCPGLSSNFGIDLVSEMIVPTDGPYNFTISSDDGSMLVIDGDLVVNNAFFQGMTARSGSDTLTAGMHFVELLYFQGGGGDGFIFTPDPNVSFTAATPEPSTIVLAAAGLLLLITGKRLASIRNRY